MDNPKVRFDLPLVCDGLSYRFGNDATKLWNTAQISLDVLERIDVIVKRNQNRKMISLELLTPQRAAELQDVFRKFDKDGSGFLDLAELQQVLQSTGRQYTDAELQKAIDNISGVENGHGLTFDQFSQLVALQMSSDWQERIRARFELFDHDGSGGISHDELAACIRGLDKLITTGEIEDMMKKCDADGNGLLSYEEFVAMVPLSMQQGGIISLSTQTSQSAVPTLPPQKVEVKPVSNVTEVELLPTALSA